MKNGWIKLHRRILEWEWFGDQNTFRLFLYLLLSANHTDKKWHGILIKKGQILTGRKKLAQKTGLSEQSIRTALSKLKSTNEITNHSTSKYTIITVNNWSKYQVSTNNPPNEQPTTNQQLTTNKNVKKDKNEKKENAAPKVAAPFILKNELQKLKTDKRPHIQLIGEYLEEKNIPLESHEELKVAIKRHSRAAVALSKFSDKRIGWATTVAEKEYPDLWTLETLVKILTR